IELREQSRRPDGERLSTFEHDGGGILCRAASQKVGVENRAPMRGSRQHEQKQAHESDKLMGSDSHAGSLPRIVDVSFAISRADQRTSLARPFRAENGLVSRPRVAHPWQTRRRSIDGSMATKKATVPLRVRYTRCYKFT